jgi:hypothetical protein
MADLYGATSTEGARQVNSDIFVLLIGGVLVFYMQVSRLVAEEQVSLRD